MNFHLAPRYLANDLHGGMDLVGNKRSKVALTEPRRCSCRLVVVEMFTHDGRASHESAESFDLEVLDSHRESDRIPKGL